MSLINMCFITIDNKCVLSKIVFEINCVPNIINKRTIVKWWQEGEEIKTKQNGHRNSYADRTRVSPWSFEGSIIVAQQSINELQQLSAAATKVNVSLYSSHLRAHKASSIPTFGKT